MKDYKLKNTISQEDVNDSGMSYLQVFFMALAVFQFTVCSIWLWV